MRARSRTVLPAALLVVLSYLGPTALADEGWTTLFDGKTLDGWKVNGGKAEYEVEGGAIVGTTVQGSPNTFLCKGDFKDFVLELEVRCDPRLNSGVQVRSHAYGKDDPDPKNRRRAGVVYGPQCEVARKEAGTAGRFYDEGRRGRWLDEIKPEARDAFKDDGWNRYRIVVQGNRYRSWVNGIAVSDFTDDVDEGGFLGLQVHGVAKGEGPYQVRWRNIRIRESRPGDESAPAKDEAPRIHRDVSYAGTSNERQALDVYAPAGGEGRPVVFWIHGGGWQAGEKTEVQAKPRAFVDRGFVFVSAGYRLLPEATIKEMAGDLAKALRWVHDHAGEYGGDPDRIFVMGHSAGAQLAALICTDLHYLEAEGLSPSILKGCVPVDGDTYDVPMQIAAVSDRTAAIYRRKFGDEERQKDLSPVTHVAKDKGIPPFLILHVADHPETGGQSQRLAKALKEAGVSATTFPAQGKDHGSINADLGLPADTPTRALFEFLDGALKK
jgi:acetyl esterase/lipase